MAEAVLGIDGTRGRPGLLERRGRSGAHAPVLGDPHIVGKQTNPMAIDAAQ